MCRVSLLVIDKPLYYFKIVIPFTYTKIHEYVKRYKSYPFSIRVSEGCKPGDDCLDRQEMIDLELELLLRKEDQIDNDVWLGGEEFLTEWEATHTPENYYINLQRRQNNSRKSRGVTTSTSSVASLSEDHSGPSMDKVCLNI